MNQLDVSMIKQFTTDDLHKLVDFIEGMPSEINRYIKMNFNEPFMDPAMYRGKDRVLHSLCTISKYINDKNNISYISNPMGSYYQSQYCKVMNDIANSNFSGMTKAKLNAIMNAECCGSNMIELETTLAELIETNEKPNELATFITENIMMYKTLCYDTHTYLFMRYGADFNMNPEFSQLYHLNCCANYIQKASESISYGHDLSIIIYVYLKELGLAECYDKYHLENRFILPLLQYNKSKEYVNDIISSLEEMVNERLTVDDALHRLVHTDEYGDIMPVKDLNISIDKNTPHSIVNDKFMYFGKDITGIRGMEEDFTNNLKRLNEKSILEYIDEEMGSINFYLSDNDYGHLNDLKGMNVATVIDSNGGDLKYIGFYENTPYLFFKRKYMPNSIFGIGILETPEGRKIFELKESKDYRYRYMNTI